MKLDDITGTIIDCAIRIHIDLGPGLLESVYETLLAKALEKRGLKVRRQYPIRFVYDGVQFDEGSRADLFVEDQVLVELKSVEKLAEVHKKQTLTYVKLLNLSIGLLINFGAPTLKQGLIRVVNSLVPATSSRLRVNQP